MKIVITAESTVDLTDEIKEKFNIKTVPFTVLLGDETHKDGEIDTSLIFDYVKKNKILPKTSAVNEYQFTEFFGGLKKEYDAIIHFSLSSEMSSAYSNAKKVADTMKGVYVVDSRTLSTGIALLAIKACKLAREGKAPEEIVKTVEELIPKTHASFVIDRLDYLYKGGRCNALQLLGANLLKLKPFINVEGGKMGVFKKYRGKWTETLKKYFDDLMEMHSGFDKDEVFITYTTAPQEIVDELSSRLKKEGFKNINVTRAGCTVTSHCGENTLGVLFISNK